MTKVKLDIITIVLQVLKKYINNNNNDIHKKLVCK